MAKASDDSRLRQTAADTAATAATTAVGMVVAGPVGALLGVTAPALSHGIECLGRYVNTRRHSRAAAVLVRAAEFAGMSPEELLAKLEQDPEREELLMRTLRVAQEAAIEEKLLALAGALSRGVSGDDSVLVEELAFVSALAGCDSTHLFLLEAFTKPASELQPTATTGANGFAGWDRPPDTLNTVQLRAILQARATLAEPIAATLERYGLIALVVQSNFTSEYGNLSPNARWQITPFGMAFLQRIAVVQSLVAPPER